MINVMRKTFRIYLYIYICICNVAISLYKNIVYHIYIYIICTFHCIYIYRVIVKHYKILENHSHHTKLKAALQTTWPSQYYSKYYTYATCIISHMNVANIQRMYVHYGHVV